MYLSSCHNSKCNSLSSFLHYAWCVAWAQTTLVPMTLRVPFLLDLPNLSPFLQQIEAKEYTLARTALENWNCWLRTQ